MTEEKEGVAKGLTVVNVVDSGLVSSSDLAVTVSSMLDSEVQHK